MPTLQEKALLRLQMFYPNQLGCSYERIPQYEADMKTRSMSLYTLRKMIRKFETIGKDILLGRGRKPIPSSSIENMAAMIVETSSHSPDGSGSGKTYYDTLRGFIIPQLQQHECLQDVTFLNDGSAHRVDCRVKRFLRQHFTDARVISCHFPTTWPRSPDIPPLRLLVAGFPKGSYLPDLKDSIRRHILDILADLLRSAVENIVLRLEHIIKHEGHALHMYGRANGNGRAALRMYRAQFPDRRMLDAVASSTFLKRVHSMSPDMMLVNEELYAVQAWKKAS
ncbi:uncharacterized protein TNCV_2737251 [Trichonephila clavipes]|nr:uncharacterized protein TNCV_2737251 [Trichonephila clavipes]